MHSRTISSYCLLLLFILVTLQNPELLSDIGGPRDSRAELSYPKILAFISMEKIMSDDKSTYFLKMCVFTVSGGRPVYRKLAVGRVERLVDWESVGLW